MASTSVVLAATACSSWPGKEIKEGLLLITPFDKANHTKDSASLLLAQTSSSMGVDSTQNVTTSYVPVYNCLRDGFERQDGFHHWRRPPSGQSDCACHGAGQRKCR